MVTLGSDCGVWPTLSGPADATCLHQLAVTTPRTCLTCPGELTLCDQLTNLPAAILRLPRIINCSCGQKRFLVVTAWVLFLISMPIAVDTPSEKFWWSQYYNTVLMSVLNSFHRNRQSDIPKRFCVVILESRQYKDLAFMSNQVILMKVGRSAEEAVDKFKPVSDISSTESSRNYFMRAKR